MNRLASGPFRYLYNFLAAQIAVYCWWWTYAVRFCGLQNGGEVWLLRLRSNFYELLADKLTIFTCNASASASLKTATDWTPKRSAVRIIRQAISPRFAINNLSIRLRALLNLAGIIEIVDLK